MTSIAVPRVIERLLALPGLSFVARLCLASAFIQSGVAKLIDFQGALAEMQHFGLRPAALLAAAVILTQLGGSVLFLTRQYCWLGAGILAVFTGLATLMAHPFWAFDGVDRVRQMATFFEHLGWLAVLPAACSSMGRPSDRACGRPRWEVWGHGPN